MKFPTRQSTPSGLPGISGTARVDRRTNAVVRRARPGDIAVIDHLDLDRSHAEALVDAGVVAVVNAAPFISGRYPLGQFDAVGILQTVGKDAQQHVFNGFRRVARQAQVKHRTVAVDTQSA